MTQPQREPSPREVEPRRTRRSWTKFLRCGLIAVTIVLCPLYLFAPTNVSSSFKKQYNVTITGFKLPTKLNITKSNESQAQLEPSLIRMKDYCPIPKLPAIDIEGIVNRTGIQILKCSERYEEFSQFSEDQERLKLISPKRKGTYSNCCVHEISRPQVMKTDTYVMGNCTPFSSSGTYTPMSPTTEYFIVKCQNHQNQTSSADKYNYHARVLTTVGSIGAKVNYWKEKTQKLDSTDSILPLNVLVLIFDSTSTQDAFRQLPKTMKYLLETMDFIQFKKYIVLGEPTMQNAIPLLVGNRAKDFLTGRNFDDRWDSVDFIWKAFNSSRFVTGYTEDTPSIGTFIYGGQTGFVEPPTDVYMTPFFLAREAFKDGYTSHRPRNKPADLCFGTKHYWNIIYDYHIELLKKLHKKAPVFQIPWLAWPFHDHFGTLKYLDQDTLRFFQQIVAEPEILDNTLIMVLADHGFYASREYSNTKVGLLERRLPLFMIRQPQKLLLQNPELPLIMKINSETVTNHYDVYQTLLELSLFKNQSRRGKTYGKSLFTLLPMNRTCQDAHIPETWCPCGIPQNKSNGEIPSEYKIHKDHSFEKIMSQHPMAKYLN